MFVSQQQQLLRQASAAQELATLALSEALRLKQMIASIEAEPDPEPMPQPNIRLLPKAS